MLRGIIRTSWFILLPASVAILTIVIAQKADPATANLLLRAIRQQPVPCGIALYALMHVIVHWSWPRLPFSNWGEPIELQRLTREERVKYDAAVQLISDSELILKKHRSAIESKVPASARTEVKERLQQLRESMLLETLDVEKFESAYAEAVSSVDKNLSRWRKGVFEEYLQALVVAFLIAIALRTQAIEPFQIPSSSMLPTLQIGDHVFVNKLIYGFRVPFTKVRLFPNMPPDRGEVVVFEFPELNAEGGHDDYIKRVIGHPGDTIEVEEGQLRINGWLQPRCRVGELHFTDNEHKIERVADLYMDFLGEHRYLTLHQLDHEAEHQGPFHVNQGELFMMGDNRTNSHDSRAWGGAPFDNVRGRAGYIWFPAPRMGIDLTQDVIVPENQLSPELRAGLERCAKEAPPAAQSLPPAASAAQ